MKFLAISDLHGWLPVIKEEFDLLMIPGDVCPDMYGVEYSQIDWFSGVFIPWINNLPFKHAWSKVIFVPGNHDKCFDGIVSKAQIMEWEFMTLGRLKILNSRSGLGILHGRSERRGAAATGSGLLFFLKAFHLVFVIIIFFVCVRAGKILDFVPKTHLYVSS